MPTERKKIMCQVSNALLAVLLCIVVLTFQSSDGADYFESFVVRLRCYKESQKGCNREITDALPEYSRSYNNLTEAKTDFFLFTKDNPDEPELLHRCGGDVPPDTNFNPKCPTEIFLPGFISGVCNFAIYRELKNERLRCGCYNVILVDWMWGNIFDLQESKMNLKIVAQQVAFVIRNLKKRYGLGADDFKVTGHSYGAHMAGFVGQIEPIGSIIGLDPAGILFTNNTHKDDRLDAGDAKCVQVFHCGGGQCLPQYFGVNFTCGTMDFWFNGGLNQSSCHLQTIKSFIKKDDIYGVLSLFPAACHHFQCLQYYKASMCPTNCQFLGVECKSYEDFKSGKCNKCGVNGENCAVAGAYACDCYLKNGRTENGTNYYLDTSLDCPFCDNSKISQDGYSCPEAFNVS